MKLKELTIKENSKKENNYLLLYHMVRESNFDGGLLRDIKPEKIPEPNESQSRYAMMALQINDQLREFSPEPLKIEYHLSELEKALLEMKSDEKCPIVFKQIMYFTTEYLRHELERVKKDIAGYTLDVLYTPGRNNMIERGR